MARLRLLNTGKWNMRPVLTAARRLLIDALASHAAKKPLGEMADFVNGTSYRPDLLADNGTPIVRISNITDPGSTFLKTREFFADTYGVESGDLLVSWSASFKSIIWPGPPGILNQHIFRVRQRSGNDRSYIRHAIEAVFDEMQQKVVGIGMMHLRRQDFLGYKVPCPDHETQRAVSGYLDWIESGRDGRQQPLPDFLVEQRRIISRIEELFAHTEEARDLRADSLQKLSLLWDRVAESSFESLKCADEPLGSLLREESLNGISTRPEHDRLGTEILRISAGTSRRDGIVDENEVRYLPVEFKRVEKYRLRPNDLLACRFNGNLSFVGRFSLYTGYRNCFQIYPDKLIRFRVDESRVFPEFVRYAMNSPKGRYKIEAMCATTAGNLGISAKQLRTVPVPVPSPQEQSRLVAYLDDLQTKIDALKKLQSESAAELDALMPSILSRAFRGEL